MPYRLARRVAFETVDDGAVLLDLDNGRYYELNAVAGRAIEMLADEREISNLVHRLLGEFEVEAKTLEADLHRLFDRLLEQGLVEPV